MKIELDKTVVIGLGMLGGSMGELMDHIIALRDDRSQPKELRKQYRYIGRKLEAAMKQIDKANLFIDRCYGEMEIDHYVGGKVKRPIGEQAR